MLNRGIRLTFLSGNGEYFGKIESTSHVNVERQLKQFKCYEDQEFCLNFSKEIISAKVRNQITVVRRYMRNKYISNAQKKISELQRYVEKILHADSKEEVMGYEGYAARNYEEVIIF